MSKISNEYILNPCRSIEADLENKKEQALHKGKITILHRH